MSKSKSLLVIIILLFGNSTMSFSQSNVKAGKSIEVITKLLIKCKNPDWMLYDILFNGNPYKEYNTLFNENPDKKIGHSILGKRNQYFKGEFGLDPRSELSKKLIDPLDKEIIRMSSENPEPQDSMDEISKKERDIGVYYVYVFINKKNIKGKLFAGENVSGTSLVTMMNRAYRDSSEWNTYFLAFGNWQNADLDPANETRSFIFKHSGESSSVQNFVVVLTGAKDRVKKLLTEIDWQKLNNILKK